MSQDSTRSGPTGSLEPMTRAQRRVLVIAILASFVSFLDGTVVNVALPAIQRDLGGGLVTQQWTVDAYLVTLGALMLVAGAVSDVFGRVRVLVAGLVGFALASLAVALAPGVAFLIAARGVQGVAGALLVPSSLAIITATLSGPARARAIGIWTSATTAAMLVGPVLGGVFVDLVTWRMVFAINILPIAAALWLLTHGGARDVRRPGARVDWWGAVLCTIALGGIVYALIEQQRLGWSNTSVWATMVVGIVAACTFLLRQRSAAYPMLPLGLFRVRNFWAGNLATVFVYAALSLNGLALGIYLQQGAGLSATLAGLASLPATVIMILFSSRIGTLAGRFGPRIFMGVGPLIMAVGALLLLSVATDFDYWWQVLPSVVVYGTGLTITVAPLTAAILGAIDESRSGIASAVNNAIARVAGLVGVALVGTIAAGSLDLDGFHRTVVAMALLLAVGGFVSLGLIRRPAR